MLKGITPCISPELLKVLCEMGHGEEIVLADANFPSESVGQKVVRADGIGAAELLSAILPMFPLDQYDDSNFVLMGVVPGDPVVPEIWNQYDEILKKMNQMQRSNIWNALHIMREQRKRTVWLQPVNEHNTQISF